MSEEEVKRVMDEMPYGLYIVGSRMDGEVNAMMADWVMQVSFNPRLVAVSFENDARTLANVRQSKVFTVNLLPLESMELAARFAQPYYGSKVKGRSEEEAAKVHHKLEGTPYQRTERGCPVLDDAMAWLECEAEQFLPTGDHTLVIARVLDGRVERDAEALTSTYTGWTYSG
ncbi:MAG: flavin reductase family protein [Dehalococcoidia bacterium]|nr:flavin reductase family protein [Dehalococcoidia bacterium]